MQHSIRAYGSHGSSLPCPFSCESSFNDVNKWFQHISVCKRPDAGAYACYACNGPEQYSDEGRIDRHKGSSSKAKAHTLIRKFSDKALNKASRQFKRVRNGISNLSISSNSTCTDSRNSTPSQELLQDDLVIYNPPGTGESVTRPDCELNDAQPIETEVS